MFPNPFYGPQAFIIALNVNVATRKANVTVKEIVRPNL